MQLLSVLKHDVYLITCEINQNYLKLSMKNNHERWTESKKINSNMILCLVKFVFIGNTICGRLAIILAMLLSFPSLPSRLLRIKKSLSYYHITRRLCGELTVERSSLYHIKAVRKNIIQIEDCLF